MIRCPALATDGCQHPQENIVLLAVLFGEVTDFEIEPEPGIGFEGETSDLPLVCDRRQLEEITDHDDLQSPER